MQLSSSDTINAPLAEVYQLIRDDLPKIASYLPDVSQIKRISEEKLPDGKTKIVNHWFSSVELPTILKKFVTDDILSWKDIAIWDDKAMQVNFSLEPFLAKSLFKATGMNEFSAESDKVTLMKVEFNIELYPENIPGMPKFIASKATPMVEALLKKILYPNISNLSKGLNDYLKKK